VNEGRAPRRALTSSRYVRDDGIAVGGLGWGACRRAHRRPKTARPLIIGILPGRMIDFGAWVDLSGMFLAGRG
jgi:hypothetical protein